jgi:hypothetical protein
MTDGTARQRLYHPGTYPAYTDHANMCATETHERRVPIQAGDTAESAIEIDFRQRSERRM